jgi:hypothetical protein
MTGLIIIKSIASGLRRFFREETALTESAHDFDTGRAIPSLPGFQSLPVWL